MEPIRYAVGLLLIVLLVALWTRLTLRSVAAQPILQRQNYLGETVTGSAGLSFVGSAILGWLLLCWRVGLDWHEGGQLMLTAFWFGVLGLLDDLGGDASAKGWRGHLRAFFREKRVTTGFVKAVGGGMGALLLTAWALNTSVPSTVSRFSLSWLGFWLFGALLVALCANAINLFDLRPSRALKGFWLLSAIGIWVSGGQGWLALLPLWVGTIAYAPADFRRKAMMGDAGSNPLGACFGIWVLHYWSPPSLAHPSAAQWGLLLALIALHIYAERRSLTQDIQRLPLLRWLDELGVRK